MKRFLTIVSALCLVASTAMAQPRYGWSISNSGANPDANTGPVAAGVATMFLWLSCSNQGMSAADISVTASVGNVVLAFNTANGFLNAGSATNLLLAVGGCPSGPVNAGSWLVLKNVPLDMCLTGANVTVDCESNPTAWPHEFVGYSETGTPCTDPIPGSCAVVSVEDSSWGSIKGLYR